MPISARQSLWGTVTEERRWCTPHLCRKDLVSADVNAGPSLEIIQTKMNPLSCNENDGDPLDRDSQYGGGQKTKRMRTSFKHHQLRTMKSYFAINHNPDAKDLKQLAQKTGLTKRVLQVWFQNARAKFRRNLLRQEGGGGSGLDKGGCEGSLLQAGTPSGPASELSNGSLSPSITPTTTNTTTLTDLTNPTLPPSSALTDLSNPSLPLASMLSSSGGMDAHECRSPPHSTLTSLF
ncbi:LIM/homeobox protein Lhx2-like [Engraulis encrasicolus]|uniref:LIM/homeobox protein Lhx2-like n=1 Tax=Engraulis encrasicolus TaxID=184585 RepID=UPI002FD589FC